MSARVIIRGVSKHYGTADRVVSALEGIDLDIAPGEFVCLLGPSGCGKSTLLNAIAGFSPPSSGSIEVGGTPVTGPGPDRGMVFQEYALFPWMTVTANVGFGLQIKGLPRAEIAARVQSLLEQLSLAEFGDRYPKDLSGGMRQRVAIARILALDPPILLMDEPFGALDALTRGMLQDELLILWNRFRKTIVFVTHSIDEAIHLADRIIILTYRPGRIKHILSVTLPRPRDLGTPEANAIRHELTALVMEEQARFWRDQAGSAAIAMPSRA